MIVRPMRSNEFALYQEYFIEDYGHELADNYGYPLEQSLHKARAELASDLPLGVATPNNRLLCLEVSKSQTPTLIGYLWYALEEGESTAFINDFYMFKNFQNQGYGAASIAILETQLSKLGIEHIKLRVAFRNSRALSLYQRLGFEITGYNMIKKIGS